MVMEIAQLVGQRVREARKLRGLSQDQLGRKLARYLGGPGWVKQTVSDIERGKRELSTTELLALALVLNLPLFWFVTPSDVTAGVSLRGQRLQIGLLLRALALGTEHQDAAGVMARYEETLLELAEAATTMAELARSMATDLRSRTEQEDAPAGETVRLRAFEVREVAEERSEEAPTGAPGREES